MKTSSLYYVEEGTVRSRSGNAETLCSLLNKKDIEYFTYKNLAYKSIVKNNEKKCAICGDIKLKSAYLQYGVICNTCRTKINTIQWQK